jgi:hypothetical protein
MSPSPSVVGAVRGRGAKSNRSGRFESRRREDFDDGWGDDSWGQDGDAEPPKLETVVTAEKARRIIATNDSPDIGFNQSINPYRGCEHGCIYCFVTQ